MDNEDQRKRSGRGGERGGIGDGIRSGIGILTAFKEAIEETIQEAVDRGDLSPERARESMRDASRRVQEGLSDARERLDFVSRREYDELREQVDALRARVADLEAGGEPRGRLDPASIPVDLG